MESPITRRQLLGSGVGASLALLAGCTASTPFVGQRLTDRELISPDDDESLRIIGDVGSIDVIGEDRTEIEIDVVKQSSSLRADLDDLTLDTTKRDGTIEIRTEYTGDQGLFESRPYMDLTISVPASLSLERVETATGNITIRDVSGDPAIEATTGRVSVSGVQGAVDAVTTTGRLSVSDVDGTVSARTTTGRVDIRDVGATGNVASTTGRIAVDVPAIEEDTRINATTGRIEANVNESIDADIVASSSTGSISTDLPLGDRTERDNYLAGTLGDGGPVLEFETNTGRISLERI